MRPTLTLSHLLGSRGRIDVLRVLWGLHVPVTAAEVARRTRLSHPAAAQVLRQLNEEGVVSSAPAGRGFTYWLARENVYVEEVLDPAFLAERDIPDMMVGEIENALRDTSVSVILFGSYARGDQTIESDVDLIAVSEDAAGKTDLQSAVDALAAAFPTRFGAHLSTIVYSRDEAEDLPRRAPDLYRSLSDDGIRVSGMDLYDWVRGEE